jgi:hypothetical protein
MKYMKYPISILLTNKKQSKMANKVELIRYQNHNGKFLKIVHNGEYVTFYLDTPENEILAKKECDKIANIKFKHPEVIYSITDKTKED